MGHINSVIIQVATALSTGNYFRSYPEKSFERNLTDVSRDLTSAADTCAMLECAAIKFQRMLGDFDRLAELFRENHEAAKVIGAGTQSRFDGEELLQYRITTLQSYAELTTALSKQIQAHIQTVGYPRMEIEDTL